MINSIKQRIPLSLKKPVKHAACSIVNACKLLIPRGKPDFFIIGAVRSGTTSLFNYLNIHPQLESARIKEPSYYGYNFNKGRSWYLTQFPPRRRFGKDTLFFEASPIYLHDPKAAQRMYGDFPNAKIVVLLRDPIERAVSHYSFCSDPESIFVKTHAKNNPGLLESRTIEEAFYSELKGQGERNIHKYCALGLYARQLQRFMRYYPIEQFHFIETGELRDETLQDTLKSLFLFLGVDEKIAHRQQYKPVVEEVNDESAFKKNDRGLMARYNVMKYDIELEEPLMTELKRFFKEDVALLQQITGRPCSWAENYLRGGPAGEKD